MKRQRIEKIVSTWLPRFAKELCLTNYMFNIEYKETEDSYMECVALDKYLEATITINPARFKSTAQVISVLRHELLHLLHAPYDDCVTEICSYFKDEGHRAIMMNFSRIYTEKLVTLYERFLDRDFKYLRNHQFNIEED